MHMYEWCYHPGAEERLHEDGMRSDQGQQAISESRTTFCR